MKRYLFILLLLVARSSFAQDVWTEGTTWVVDFAEKYNPFIGKFESPRVTYTLKPSVEVNGRSYFPLTKTSTDKTGKEETVIEAYIRSERGDSLVYAIVMHLMSNEMYPDRLLYDFTKSFEYGDTLRYGTSEDEISKLYISDEYPIEYLHDIIEEGDSLPVWNNIIYKLGHIEGPTMLFHTDWLGTDIDDGSKPKTTNVSHILFGTRKGAHAEIDFDPATGIVRRFTFIDEANHIYDLQGRRLYSIPEEGIYIKNGKKIINVR